MTSSYLSHFPQVVHTVDPHISEPQLSNLPDYLNGFKWNYSELRLIWIPEMWPPLYSGHLEKSPKIGFRIQIQHQLTPEKMRPPL